MEPQIGEVYAFVEKRPNELHFFGIIGKRDDGSFDCCMFTTAPAERYADNIPLQKDHIKRVDENGALYRFQHYKSHFVSVMLIKPVNFLNIVKAGELTEVGLEYIKVHKATLPAMEWDDYRKSQ